MRTRKREWMGEISILFCTRDIDPGHFCLSFSFVGLDKRYRILLLAFYGLWLLCLIK